MWLGFAFLSATLLGCYDVCKKHALMRNSVIPVLLLNTLCCSLLFLPWVVLSFFEVLPKDHLLYVDLSNGQAQYYLMLKSVLVLSSWLFGYLGMKHLPITLVGPINATRPILVLVGAMCIFGERLNLYQWIGVGIALCSFFLLSKSGKKEGIDFRHNRWILFVILSALLGASSGLYDKFLMASVEEGGAGLQPMMVQSCYNFYQLLFMSIVAWCLSKKSHTSPLQWTPSILLISIFLSLADFAYFYALSLDGAMISVVSMIRRGSVVVSFLLGARLFHEKNLKSKCLDLLFVLLGLFFLYLGTTH